MNSRHYAIICGMQRSGTRQFADFLKRDPRVCLQGEISIGLLPHMAKLVKRADGTSTKGRFGDIYAAKRQRVVTDMFAQFGKAAGSYMPDAEIQGFKSPHAQRHYKQLCQMLLPSYARLTFFFCIRDFQQTYLSLTAMPWFTQTAEAYQDRYLRHLKLAISMRKTLPDGAQIIPLHLNEFIKADDQPGWITDNLYTPLGLDITRERAAHVAQTTENSNATIASTGAPRPKALADDALAVFAARRDDMMKMTSRFNKTFGTSLDNEIRAETVAAAG